MSKSSRSLGGNLFGGRRGRRGGSTITVIEDRVHRSSERNARFAAIITAILVTLVGANVAADNMNHLLALLVGAFFGIICGGIVWILVRVWPVLRVIWWWLPEIIIVLLLVNGWLLLAAIDNLAVRLLILAVVVGVPLAFAVVRRNLVAFGWCLIVRHRLRVCFSQFIIANRSGSLPLIMWAVPTPVGERVWVYLRPGLSLGDLEQRADKLAVACHAKSVVAQQAKPGNAAYLQIDVKRRDVLNVNVGSPLVDIIGPDAPTAPRTEREVPTALDLPDVPATEPVNPKPGPNRAQTNDRKPTGPERPHQPVAGPGGEDVSDWID